MPVYGPVFMLSHMVLFFIPIEAFKASDINYLDDEEIRQNQLIVLRKQNKWHSMDSATKLE